MDEFVNYIRKYYKAAYDSGKRRFNDLFPSFQIIGDALGISQGVIIEYLESLSGHPGDAEGNIYSYYSGMLPKKAGPVSEKTTIISWAFLRVALRIMLLIGGTIFIVMGVTYVYHGNNYFLHDPLDSKLRSVGFMLMAILCFEVWLFYWIKGSALSWFFLICYIGLNIYNSMTVLYYQNMKYQDMNLFSSVNVQMMKDDSKRKSLDDNITSIDKDIEALRVQLAANQKILAEISEDNPNYWTYYWSINSRNAKYPGYLMQIEKKAEKREALSSERDKIIDSTDAVKSSKKELFTGKVLMFYLLVPSVAIEFFASICFGLVLYLKFE